MGMVQHTSNGKSFNYRFSAFLGTTFLANAETSAVLSEVKAVIDDATWKKGFTGVKGDTPTAKAMKIIQGRVPYGAINGRLTFVQVKDVDVQGIKMPYLTIGLKDNEGMHYVSLALSNPAAQMMVRKLSAATPGKFTELKYFSMLDEPNEHGVVYSSDACYLRQGSEGSTLDKEDEIKGISYADGPKVSVDAAGESVKAALASVGGDVQKNAVRDAKKAAALKYHLELMDQIRKKFEADSHEEGSQAGSHELPPGYSVIDTDDCPF